MRRSTAFLAAASLAAQTVAASATPFINEFHYDNTGTDTGEFVELAGGAGWDLTGWTLQLLNGNPTQLNRYDTVNLSGTFTNQSNGWGFLSFQLPTNGLQNGGSSNSPTTASEGDGIALVDAGGTLVQFLSYEGQFTPNAGNGPASGVTSAFIGSSAFEPSTTAVGFSLRLTGTQAAGTQGGSLGSQPNGFAWAAPAAATSGSLNTGQTFTQTPPPPPPPPPPANDKSIAEIQGESHSSPLVGQSVSTTGVVSQVVGNGYYLMSDRPDQKVGTSEGLFVFTGTNGAKPSVGNLVRVSGTVTEFLPGNSQLNTTLTELTGSTFSVTTQSVSVPAATVIGQGGRLPPQKIIENSANIANFDPVNAGRDFYESLEGMLVTIKDATSVASTVTFSNGNREVWVKSDAPTNSLNTRGGLTIAADSDPQNVQGVDYNPERIQIDAFGNNAGPLVNTGDKLGDVTGVVSYDFGSYEIVPSTVPTITTPGDLPKESTKLRGSNRRMTYADYNVENLGTAESTRITDLGGQIVNRLGSPDVLGLQELLAIDDNGQPQDIGQTLQGIVNAVAAAGGPTYAYAFLPAQGSLDDRIVNAYLYNPARVSLVAGSVQYVPGVIEAASSYNDARGPLVAQFVFNGQTITTINNHWSSRGGSDPLYGDEQPPAPGSESRRQGQGEVLNAYVAALLATDPKARIIVNGDLNSFYFENPQVALRGTGVNQILFGLYELLGVNERYSYNFDGNAQELDYIYASSSLFNYGAKFDIVHYNSQYLDQFSDHDPLVSSLLVPAPSVLLLFGLGVAGFIGLRRRRAGI